MSFAIPHSCVYASPSVWGGDYDSSLSCVGAGRAPVQHKWRSGATVARVGPRVSSSRYDGATAARGTPHAALCSGAAEPQRQNTQRLAVIYQRQPEEPGDNGSYCFPDLTVSVSDSLKQDKYIRN